MSPLSRWTAADSMELFNIRGWGQGYFDVNNQGHLAMRPNQQNPAMQIDLVELVEDAQQKGIALPLLIRFSDILHDRLDTLRQGFDRAMEASGYKGSYLPVYPIKVNQQRQVVEEVVRFGTAGGMGLEAGSKPELHAALAMQNEDRSLVICNGYKDSAYIRLALLSQKLGKRVFLVVEKLGELQLILDIAREEKVEPLIGIRIKLVSSGSGRWEASGGDFSKFGLTASELVEAVELLKQADMLHRFQLIHFHLGSQVTNIRRVKEALGEAVRYFAELTKLGCAIGYVDVGGGLGVDYDGSRSSHHSSINYTEEEYANDVVYALEGICRAGNLPHPIIITECGRAMTAHHAMLAINVFETASLDQDPSQREAPSLLPPADRKDTPEVIEKLEEIQTGLTVKNLSESWHDALYFREEGNRMFQLGLLSLNHRAAAQRLFWRIARGVERLSRGEKRVPEDVEALDTLLADKYFCNFSVFQSLPDSWAIDQQFPILPLDRLKEKPTRNVVLQDLTCDSDGKIDNFIGPRGRQPTLPLHPLKPNEPYYLGVFLTGAYQEILGDLHNLFGDTNAIHVALNPDGSWRYEQVIQGEKVSDVLDYVNFGEDDLLNRVDSQISRQIKAGNLTPEAGQAYRNLYRQGLDSYTYLERPKEVQPARPKRP
ncbi:MAG: biosynthetic arginine decarboxylase [Deltaproteobacteria bacterium]|nr:biosynthetic arginine decarboxylase [Deltaproteobacteria bacterium]